MRGCDNSSCLSVLSAGRHREGQTCVSMAMSSCNPFPVCWDRGTNEKPAARTHTLKEAHRNNYVVVSLSNSETSDSMETSLVPNHS